MRNFSLMEHLALASKYLSGTSPEYIFMLPRLRELSLQDNLFSGELSSIELLCSSFTQISGGIPASLSISQSISSLSLRNNTLNGLIDFNCSAMIILTLLDLGSIEFHGSIPNNPACPNLKAINFARNNISGQIPETFKNFGTLSQLSLWNRSFSNLSAALEILQHCPNLTSLVLTMNFCGEVFPSDPSVQFKALKVFIIASSRLTGAFPQWLSSLTQLLLLDLSWNNLSGPIPPFFRNLQSLFYMDLSNNSLSGEISQSLARLPSLRFIVNFLGRTSLILLVCPENKPEWQRLLYNKIFSFPPTLDLSNNCLTEPIWPEFGNLKELHALVLKGNNLLGNIPSTLSSMTSIETLDLSNNNLWGTTISLVRLSFLSKFCIAYNNLSGEIPNAGQFPTFQNSSFAGNPGLCGAYYASPCQTSQGIPPQTTRNLDEKKGPLIGTAVWIGYGTSFLLALVHFIFMPALGDMLCRKGESVG